MIDPILTISIVHFNTAEITIKCIDSLTKILDDSPLRGRYELSIVDNRSRVSEYLCLENFLKKKNRDNIFLQRNCMNAGFGLGCMLTLNKSAGKYILFVNSDTYFDQDCFTKLVHFMDGMPDAAIVTPQHLDERGEKIRSFGYFDTLSSRFLGNWFLKRRSVTSTKEGAVAVDFVIGSFMLVRRDAFAKVGGFDPNIFLYYEEMDISMRLKKVGFKTYFYPVASFRHIGNASTGVMSDDLRFEAIISMLYFIYKHHGLVYGFVFHQALRIQYFLKSLAKNKNRKIFIRLIKMSLPQVSSMRLRQTCEFLDQDGLR